MSKLSSRVGCKLPVNPEKSQGAIAQGFVTPKQDICPQIHSIPPKRVIPIVFIPGIMGSNLRMTAERQDRLNLENNISWRPDNSGVTVRQYDDSAVERQLRLDPRATEVDHYDPKDNKTGNALESADQRNENVIYAGGYRGWANLDGPTLQADPPGTKNRKNQNQKARERGWGEIYYSSYEKVLSICENKLNSAFTGGPMDLFLNKNIAGVDPIAWDALTGSPLKALDEQSMRDAVKGCWFPMHAMGYNWLQGNAESGLVLAKRIENLIEKYNMQGFQCEKVILVTHSMGGLVARAIIHPEIGKINEKILGIIHGVMPAVGAGAAYRRMRCGVESNGFGPTAKITAGILGNNAREVTAVLADAQGALELLPSRFYGNHWLEVRQGDKLIGSWPENCPYEEIYKIPGKWFGLLVERWMNPADIVGRGFPNTVRLLEGAKKFHEIIYDTYHAQSYAHYCADIERKAWYKVVWNVQNTVGAAGIEKYSIATDDQKGKLRLVDSPNANGIAQNLFDVANLEASEPGDQTVPSYSADAQIRSKKFKGIFRQNGYEHQESYDNPKVIAATIYCLFRVIAEMRWVN